MGKHKHRNDRQERREQFTQLQAPARRSPWKMILAVAVLLFLGVTAYAVVGRRGPTPEAATAAGTATQITLPAAQFADGQAKFYRYTTAGGRELRFFVMKSADGVVRAAFDTCDICYRAKKGYHQEGDDMVCNNCGRHFKSTDINVLQGGCNPAPLDRVVQSDNVVLSAAALEAGAWYF